MLSYIYLLIGTFRKEVEVGNSKYVKKVIEYDESL